MTHEELLRALEKPDKASSKALSRWATELEEQEPELYKMILSKKDWEGKTLEAYQSYRRAYLLSRCAMGLAVPVIIGAYLLSDFGLGLLEGLWKRYCLAIGATVAMGLFAGGSLLHFSRKERFLAYGYLEETEEN